ncbi:transcription factor ALC [Ricinus communis]|uniref:BHLH domain-containing protein n=1 Tax=Ricinus communis TaxID=3988 RepID=B9SM10_RICCO|nr:transcription factor ALC [Ricinus communis]EEF35401.1 hypothetical protein RCOM_1311480 [Ricinus communis]
METDSSLDIFGSLSEIQSLPYLHQASPTNTNHDQFLPILCGEKSSASSKRKSIETHDDHYDDIGGISGEPRRNKNHRNRKRISADMRNIYERRRRDRIRDKMKSLRELIPHCHKQDRASMLDDAINYLKALKLHVEMLANMGGRGALCQAPSSPAATPYFCPVIQTNSTSEMRMFSTSLDCQAPPPSFGLHLQLQPSSLPAPPPLQQISPLLLFPRLPLLGAATSTPLLIASSSHGHSATSQK